MKRCRLKFIKSILCNIFKLFDFTSLGRLLLETVYLYNCTIAEIFTRIIPPPLEEVLGTFPKAFPQGRLPKWQFPIWQHTKCAITQAATSQRLGKALWGAAGCNGSQALRLGWATVPSAEARTGWGRVLRKYLGSCRLGKCHLGKILSKKSFGKVPNIFIKINVQRRGGWKIFKKIWQC